MTVLGVDLPQVTLPVRDPETGITLCSSCRGEGMVAGMRCPSCDGGGFVRLPAIAVDVSEAPAADVVDAPRQSVRDRVRSALKDRGRPSPRLGVPPTHGGEP